MAKILNEDYPNEDHILIFNNAKTHVKRAEGSLSAIQMPKGPSTNFMVEVNDIGDDRKLKYTEGGKILKKKIPMSNGVMISFMFHVSSGIFLSETR